MLQGGAWDNHERGVLIRLQRKAQQSAQGIPEPECQLHLRLAHAHTFTAAKGLQGNGLPGAAKSPPTGEVRRLKPLSFEDTTLWLQAEGWLQHDADFARNEKCRLSQVRLDSMAEMIAAAANFSLPNIHSLRKSWGQ